MKKDREKGSSIALGLYAMLISSVLSMTTLSVFGIRAAGSLTPDPGKVGYYLMISGLEVFQSELKGKTVIVGENDNKAVLKSRLAFLGTELLSGVFSDGLISVIKEGNDYFNDSFKLIVPGSSYEISGNFSMDRTGKVTIFAQSVSLGDEIIVSEGRRLVFAAKREEKENKDTHITYSEGVLS